MSSTQGDQPRRRRGQRRRPAAPDPATGGPIQPIKQKKPPPQPSGEHCIFGICCHFGLTCVNPHSNVEVEFFKQREELRLLLREMQLQVEQKKVDYKRQRARQPLGDLGNRRQAASNRGAATQKPPTEKTDPPTQKKSATPQGQSSNRGAAVTQQQRTATVGAAQITGHATTAPRALPATPVTPRPTTPSRPPPSTTATTTTAPATVTTPALDTHPHYMCMLMGEKCSSECAVRTAVDDPRWVGRWKVEKNVWGRSAPPSWDQQPDPNPEYRYVLDATQQHTVNINYAVQWGTNDQWVHDIDTDLWFPIRKQDGTILMRPCPVQQQ